MDGDDPAWHDWEHALTVAEIEGLTGSFALIAPERLFNADYVQATFVPGGFLLEYREHWPSEDVPGFRHYRARKSYNEAEDGTLEGAACHVFDLEAAMDCFRCFLEYPNEFPEIPGQWEDVTDAVNDI